MYPEKSIMKVMTDPFLKVSILLLFISSLNSGCTTLKHPQLLYFNTGSAFKDSALMKPPVLTIQPNDELEIGTSSANPDALKPYTWGGGLTNIYQPVIGNSPTSQSLTQTYRVNMEGFIDYPGLGRIKMAGLNSMAATDTLSARLRRFVNDAVVSIKFKSLQVTVLGEVAHPGPVPIPGERLNILEAIGQAGESQLYASRNNLKVLRLENGVRTIHHINLQQKDSLFMSQAFWLRQNDVVYVEPLDQKRFESVDQSQRFLPWVTALAALLTVVNIIVR